MAAKTAAHTTTHVELAQKMKEKIGEGYELFDPPILSEKIMYQSMTEPIYQTSQMPTP